MEPENEKKTNVGNSKKSETGSDFERRNVSNSGRIETGGEAYDRNLSNKKGSESNSEAKSGSLKTGIKITREPGSPQFVKTKKVFWVY